MDLLYDGILIDNSAYTLIYLNDGTGNFIEQSTNLPGTGEPGSVDWADIDNDGDLDVLLSEYLFRNEGNGLFNDISPWAPHSYYAIPAMFMDYDIDGDADIFMLSFFGISNSNIFRNELVTGISGISSFRNLSVYPNPSNGVFSISTDFVQIKSCKLFSLDGKMIQSFHVSNFSKVDIGDLSPGVYIFEVSDGKYFGRVKLIIV
ncbi:MAG: T9SS type A sorting domain-containing protein [Bacteroidetes bacterium]|nr:T9SS type A sorting domain-containing protein [Bacteroidota bacterium]